MKPTRCACGRVPGVRCARVAEDIVETWVQCPGCAATGDRIEDAYRDDATAIADWNSNGGIKR
ncbi:hypothetical protein [Sphingomonas sp. ID0503]|uniref:hypothetical protein n=1 Tax=Sphingomonas sp. ID0503 TaxID=3399691 RepID=UPI003AFAC2F9